MMSAHQHIQDFLRAMETAGVVPQGNIAGELMSGDLVRFACEGDGRKKNGWATFFPAEQGSPAAGAFGNFKMQIEKITWRADSDAPVLSAQERAELRRKIDEERLRKDREKRESEVAAAKNASAMWADAGPLDHAHEYCLRKRISPVGLKQSGRFLLVPMVDHARDVWNLQKIAPDGFKLFMPDARIVGLFWVIGTLRGSRRCVIVEGYATGDAVHQATGLPVVVAFNTANLPHVAASWKARAPAIDWVIGADDDHKTGLDLAARGMEYKNPGIEVAARVGEELHMKVAVPPSYRARVRNGGEGEAINQDFSDVFLAGDSAQIAASIAGARYWTGDDAPVSLAEQIGRAA